MSDSQGVPITEILHLAPCMIKQDGFLHKTRFGGWGRQRTRVRLDDDVVFETQP
jgi:hypothetical protein